MRETSHVTLKLGRLPPNWRNPNKTQPPVNSCTKARPYSSTPFIPRPLPIPTQRAICLPDFYSGCATGISGRSLRDYCSGAFTFDDSTKKLFDERIGPTIMKVNLLAEERLEQVSGWGAARLSETSGCGKLNRNRRLRDVD
jgi:hypothetical protein